MNPEISRRQHSIMEFIREHGSVQVDQLSAYLKVTPQTIRRDLNQLYDLELVQRVHGGAVIRDTVENLGYGARKTLMAEEKQEIARRAAELLPDNASMFIDIGTTTERVAEYLVDRKGMLVVTNNINVASTLWPSREIEVMIAGGTIRNNDGGIVGSSTEEFVNKFKLDFAVIGCSAIDPDGEIFDYDLREVRVAQAIIQRARAVILVTDSMKFQRHAPVRIGDLDEIDMLVTDAGISAEAIQLCENKKVQLEIAGKASLEAAAGEARHGDRAS